jgi:uncharacterized protein
VQYFPRVRSKSSAAPLGMNPINLVTDVRNKSSDPENPSTENLVALINRIRTVAIVGLSRDPAKAARRVPSYMAAKGYDIIPVNPLADRILGKQARASLGEVTEAVDMVMIFRPSSAAGTIMAEAASRPERPVIWLQEGIKDSEVAADLRSRGLTVVQDLCFYKVHRAANQR